MGNKVLRLGQIAYTLVFYNISFSWLLALDGFQYIFCCVTVKTIYYVDSNRGGSSDFHYRLQLKITRYLLLPTSDFQLPTSDFLPLLNYFPAQNKLVFCCTSAGIFSDFWLFTTFYFPYVINYSPTSYFRLPTSDFRLPPSDFRLPSSDLGLQTFHHFLIKSQLKISSFSWSAGIVSWKLSQSWRPTS